MGLKTDLIVRIVTWMACLMAWIPGIGYSPLLDHSQRHARQPSATDEYAWQ